MAKRIVSRVCDRITTAADDGMAVSKPINISAKPRAADEQGHDKRPPYLRRHWEQIAI